MAQMKMLQRMRILEEKGQQYAITQVKDLKVFGESAGTLAIQTIKQHWVTIAAVSAAFAIALPLAADTSGFLLRNTCQQYLHHSHLALIDERQQLH